MKKLKYVLLLSVLLGTVFSCQKVLDELLTFSFKMSSDFTIPSTVVVDLPITLSTPEIAASSSSEFEDNGSSVDKVKDVKLTSMVLSITSPSDQEFGFLNEIKIYMNSEGLEEILIASKTDIPDTEDDELELDVEDVALESYIKKDKFTLRVAVITDELIAEPIDITSDMTFDVTADPI